MACDFSEHVHNRLVFIARPHSKAIESAVDTELPQLTQCRGDTQSSVKTPGDVYCRFTEKLQSEYTRRMVDFDNVKIGYSLRPLT